MGVVSWRELDRYFAEAYCDAAMAGAEMRAASGAIETLRDAVNALPAGKTVMEAWADFDEQVGLGDLYRLVPVLVKLRGEFEKIATEREIFRLQRVFDRDRDAGWAQWLETYARSFSPWGWRTAFGVDIARHGLKGTSPSNEWSLNRIREAAVLVDKGRWSETYDWFIFLSEQELPAELRAQMLATASEIQLYHFYQPSKAKSLLEQADALAAEDLRLKVVWGEYWLYKEDFDRAIQTFEQVIQGMPDISDGYTNMGDVYDQMGEPVRAEDLYQQATVNAPGAVDGYRRLLSFHGNSARFSEREGRLAPLLERIKTLDEDLPYAYVSMGLIYKENRDFDKAREYFDQALREDPAYALAYVWKGYTYLDQISDPAQHSHLIQEARACFEKVAEIAPGTIDGPWGIMRLEMQLGNWQAALEACNQCFDIHPEWESFVLVGRADIYRELGQLEQAEADLQSSLHIEPDNPGAISVLTSLAESYKTVEDKAVALRAMETLRGIKGETYEQTYQNLIGNMHYYFSEYDQALQRYRLAVEAKPDDDVLHSNLALACERLNTPGMRLEVIEEAIQHLQQAIALNPEEVEYPVRIHTLEAERDFIRTYGEAARELTPQVPAIRIRISDNLGADILNDQQTNLSDESRQAIDNTRQHMREALGVELPGVLFSYLENSYNLNGRYEIYFQETLQDFGYADSAKVFARMAADPGEPQNLYDTPYGHWLDDPSALPESERQRYAAFYSVTEYILDHMRRIATANPMGVFAFQDMINLLAACDDQTVQAVKSSPAGMLRYALVLKLLLAKGISLENIQDITSAYLQLVQETDDAAVLAERIAGQTTRAPSSD